MSHLTQISFNNFRVFNSKTTFDLAPITFLTGPNSSGKSSVLKALLLLKSNYNSDLQVLDFSGPKHNLGTFENTINSKVNDESIVIGLQTNLGSGQSFGFNQGTFFKQAVTTKRGVYTILKEFDDTKKTTITIELTYKKNDRSGKLKKIELFIKDDSVPFLVLKIGNSNINSLHELFIDGDKISKDKILTSIFHDPLRIQEAEFLKKIKPNKSYSHSTVFSPKENAKDIYIDEPIAVFTKLYEKYVLENFDLKKRKEIHSIFSQCQLKEF